MPPRLNDRSSALRLLETRRSGRPRDMVAPGPDRHQLARILAIATRVPDHGKLAPWRFVSIEDRDAFASLLHHAYRTEQREDPGRLETQALEDFARQAPLAMVAISEPRIGSSIHIEDQRWSMGAAIQNFQLAATAMGFVSGWLTGWATHSTTVREAFEVADEAKIAGFLFVGSPGKTLEERTRPAVEIVWGRWKPSRTEAK